MEVGKTTNFSFGQIFVSQPMLKTINEQYKAMPKESRPDKKTFMRNWKRCQDTTEFDLLIRDDEKVFLINKKGQKVMEENLLEKFVWNIDTALKRILLFEDAAKAPQNIEQL